MLPIFRLSNKDIHGLQRTARKLPNDRAGSNSSNRDCGVIYLGTVLRAYYDHDGRLCRSTDRRRINAVRRSARSVAGQVGEAEAGRTGEVSDVDGGWIAAASVVYKLAKEVRRP
jgi:hypothetical protein